MRILVDRYKSNDEATLSKVSVHDDDDSVLYRCYGLEDEYRTEKVMHETRIPAGTYRVANRRRGGFFDRYRKRWPEWHRGMLQVADVPGFTDILIHCGNNEGHTSGCLLVGVQANESAFEIYPSRPAYIELYKLCIDACEAGNLHIIFRDSDRDKFT